MFERGSVSRRAFLKLAGLSSGFALAGVVAPRAVAAMSELSPRRTTGPTPTLDEVSLPAPRLEGTVSLEQALLNRRSQRSFSEEPLSLEQIAQLLWAAQGVTDPGGKRTAPSAGAAYPIELYVVWAEGCYQYKAAGHLLLVKSRDDLRAALSATPRQQAILTNAPAVFVVTAVHERMRSRFRSGQSDRFMHLEAGHVAQNLLLQAVALGLVGVPMGGIEEDKIQAALDLPGDYTPLYLIPIGYARG